MKNLLVLAFAVAAAFTAACSNSGGAAAAPSDADNLLADISMGGVDSTRVTPLLHDYAEPTDPGAAVLVVKNGEVACALGFGSADLVGQAPVTMATSFRLASLSKAFTATAVLLLVRDGKLGLDTRVTDVLLDFPAYGRKITIRHLLSHTSGLIDYEKLVAEDAPDQLHDQDVVALLAKAPDTTFEPGTKFEYSNSGYALLAMIVEQASGVPFARFLRERIFQPLNMDGAVAFEVGRSTVRNRAFGHARDGRSWYRADQSPTSAVLGDGGVYASIEDLLLWEQAIHDRLLLADLQAEMFRPAVLSDGTSTGYGFGWFLDDFDGHARQRHTGTTRGFRHAYLRFPDDHLTVIVLTNRDEGEPQKIAESVARLYLDTGGSGHG